MLNDILQKIYFLMADIDYKDDRGNSNLHLAAEQGDLNWLHALLRAGANIHALNNNNVQALHLAAGWGHTDCLNALIQAGANIDATNNNGYTALHNATCWGHTDCLNALIQAGANIHTANNDGETALHLAAVWGQTNCLNALIQAEANIHATDNQDGYTALHVAALEGNADSINVLIQAGADIHATNYYGDTALHEAAASGETDCLNALIQAGANIHATNNDGETAITMAFENGHHDIVRNLQQRGAVFPEQIHLQVNNRQSTHEASVHISVSKSAQALKAHYLNGDFNEAQAALEQWLSTQTHENYAEPAKRALARLKGSDFVEGRSNINLKDALALVWLGVNDKNETTPIETRQEALLESLYRIQRGYNINGRDEDNGQDDSPICTSGAFNQLINTLGEGRHSKVNIVMLSKEIVTAKATALLPNIVNDVFCALDEKEQEALAKNWETPFPEAFKEAHIDKVQANLKAALQAEYAEQKDMLYDFDEHVDSIVGQIEYMDTKTIDAVTTIKDKLENKNKRQKTGESSNEEAAPLLFSQNQAAQRPASEPPELVEAQEAPRKRKRG